MTEWVKPYCGHNEIFKDVNVRSFIPPAMQHFLEEGKEIKPRISRRMLSASKEKGHVEVVSLLQKMSNTRPKAITLDVEMEDYYRIKGDRTND